MMPVSHTDMNCIGCDSVSLDLALKFCLRQYSHWKQSRGSQKLKKKDFLRYTHSQLFAVLFCRKIEVDTGFTEKSLSLLDCGLGASGTCSLSDQCLSACITWSDGDQVPDAPRSGSVRVSGGEDDDLLALGLSLGVLMLEGPF